MADAKETAGNKASRVKVEDMSEPQRALTQQEQRQVKGGGLGSAERKAGGRLADTGTLSHGTGAGAGKVSMND